MSLLLACGLALAACSGPRTVVTNAKAGASPLVGFTRVEATLVNSGGEGDVTVNARVRDPLTGRMFSAEHSVSLREHETLGIILDVPSPAGSHLAAVTATFPPD